MDMNAYELAHHGVKGMKWGVRKKQPKSDIRKNYDVKKRAAKLANREYNKSFNKAYNYSGNHPISQNFGKRKDKSNALWDDAYAKGDKANKAKKAYKSIKEKRKNRINEEYRKMQQGASFKDKLMYNNATRKKAAKYVVDNNMSVKDARKKANKAAVRNTAMLLALYGGATLAAKKFS